MYATPLQLTDLIRQFQTTDTMPAELVGILDKIITGLAARYRLERDLDDRRQEFYLLMLRKKNNIKLGGGNVFSYLTTCAFNLLRRRGKTLLLLDDLRTPD